MTSHPLRRTGPDDDPGPDPELRSKGFPGGTPAEVFAKAAAWLARNDGAVGVLDIGWHYIADAADPWDLTIYYYPE